MKISFITTVFNEEKTIVQFLTSLRSQTLKPDEIIIVDGGSTDATVSVISSKQKNLKIKIIEKRGNRSIGRNEAIKNATGDVIICSDAGNILDRNWIKNIVKPFINSKIDVVAGYYKGKVQTVFQKSLIPYVLVMVDKVDPNNFLPATRSMAFRKTIWKKIGGFNEKLSHNEDYDFSRRLEKIKAKIVFAKDAIVCWIPRKNFKETFVMFFRFAFGDAEATIFRSKVLLIFLRYILSIYFIFLIVLYRSLLGAMILLACILLYLIWSVSKNYKYVNDKQAIFILPFLQITSDIAVLSGTTIGLLKTVLMFNYWSYINKNKFLFFVILIYTSLLLFTLRWGIPNVNHPFPYHMDEWHQLQAVANTFRYGSPNTAGSANGTMLHFLLSGFYLVPFIFLKIIDPFLLQIDNSLMKERIFEVLRLQTIIFGILSTIVFYKIAEILNISRKLAIFLFTFTPIWLSLSGYFKYDIALMFWIITSFYFLIRFSKDPNDRNFLLSAIPCGLAVAVKVSAIPLFALYIFSYLLFKTSWKENIRYLLSGITLFIFIILIFGMPDMIFGKGNILVYLYENIVQSPQTTSWFQIGMNPYMYLFYRHYPVIFGHGLFLLFIISTGGWIYIFLKNGLKKSLRYYRLELFLFISFLVFLISLLPLQVWAAGNRSLVLLPFFVLIIGSFVQQTIKLNKLRVGLVIFISLVFLVQTYELLAWIYMKSIKSPQEISSEWIEKNIPKSQVIGIENIPIYQNIPDIIQKEFYFSQYNIKQDNRYAYQVIDYTSNMLPKIIVLTNSEINDKLLKDTPQKKLLRRFEKEGYKKRVIFLLDFKYSRVFLNDVDYYFSGLLAAPITTTVFER